MKIFSPDEIQQYYNGKLFQIGTERIFFEETYKERVRKSCYANNN